MQVNQQAASALQHDIDTVTQPKDNTLEQQMLQSLEERRITPDRQLPKMEFLFRLFHKPCFPRGELVALSGKAKSGKTFISSILMSLCFRSPLLSVERIAQQPLHVLWYDTEQSEESTQDILNNRILQMTGIPRQQFPMQMFDIFNVRAVGYERRLTMLEVAVRHFKPDLVVLDGIRDLVADINDGVVAQDCIERLMHLASETRCCIACVLHQNKSAEDRNLRGWIGTELKNKAFEVYECTKTSERIFVWSQMDTRKYDILDALKFAVDEQGIPYLCSEEQLKEALFNAQRMAADKINKQQGTKATLAPFNPKYVEAKAGKRTIFRLRELFADSMQPGREYTEEELQTQVGITSNIATERIFLEQVHKAISQGIIMRSKSAVNGKNIYMLHPAPAEVKASGPIRTSLYEREGSIWPLEATFTEAPQTPRP